MKIMTLELKKRINQKNSANENYLSFGNVK